MMPGKVTWPVFTASFSGAEISVHQITFFGAPEKVVGFPNFFTFSQLEQPVSMHGRSFLDTGACRREILCSVPSITKRS
jgi:hypothetical protein